MLSSLSSDEHRFVIGSLVGVGATAGVFWWLTRRADQQALANKSKSRSQSSSPTATPPNAFLDGSASRTNFPKKPLVRSTPSLIQTSIFTFNTAAWLVYGLYLKRSSYWLSVLSKLKTFILDNDSRRKYAFSFLSSYHAAIYYPCWAILGFSCVHAFAAARRYKVVRAIGKALRHPAARTFVQMVGYGGAWYSMLKDLLLSESIPAGPVTASATDLSRINSVAARAANGPDGGLEPLPFVLGTFGQYYGALHLLNAYCVNGMQQQPLFTFLNVNVSIYAALLVKAGTFALGVLEKSSWFDASGPGGSRVGLLQAVSSLSVLDQAYGLYNFYNCVYVGLNSMFPWKMDDYYVKTPKATESLFIMFGTVLLMFMMKLRGEAAGETSGSQGSSLLRNIFLNEMYFYALPLFYYIEYTLRYKEMTQVEKNLFICNLVTASRKEMIEKYKIKNIVELHGLNGTNDVVHKKVHYLVIEAIDRAFTTDLIDHFDQTNAFIKNAVRKGENVAVHCRYGVSRSSTIVMAYLLGELGYEWDEALDRMNQLRMQFDPNNGYMMQLREYYDSIREQKRVKRRRT